MSDVEPMRTAVKVSEPRTLIDLRDNDPIATIQSRRTRARIHDNE